MIPAHRPDQLERLTDHVHESSARLSGARRCVGSDDPRAHDAARVRRADAGGAAAATQARRRAGRPRRTAAPRRAPYRARPRCGRAPASRARGRRGTRSASRGRLAAAERSGSAGRCDSEVWSASHFCCCSRESRSAWRCVSCFSIDEDLADRSRPGRAVARMLATLARWALTRASVSITWVVTSSTDCWRWRRVPRRPSWASAGVEGGGRDPQGEVDPVEPPVRVGAGLLVGDVATEAGDQVDRVLAGGRRGGRWSAAASRWRSPSVGSPRRSRRPGPPCRAATLGSADAIGRRRRLGGDRRRTGVAGRRTPRTAARKRVTGTRTARTTTERCADRERASQRGQHAGWTPRRPGRFPRPVAGLGKWSGGEACTPAGGRGGRRRHRRPGGGGPGARGTSRRRGDSCSRAHRRSAASSVSTRWAASWSTSVRRRCSTGGPRRRARPRRRSRRGPGAPGDHGREPVVARRDAADAAHDDGHPARPASALAESGVISKPGLARAAMDAVLPATSLEGRDTSVGGLVEERFGKEVVDRLVEPLLGGVYAGHARETVRARRRPAGGRAAGPGPLAGQGGRARDERAGERRADLRRHQRRSRAAARGGRPTRGVTVRNRGDRARPRPPPRGRLDAGGRIDARSRGWCRPTRWCWRPRRVPRRGCSATSRRRAALELARIEYASVAWSPRRVRRPATSRR